MLSPWPIFQLGLTQSVYGLKGPVRPCSIALRLDGFGSVRRLVLHQFSSKLTWIELNLCHSPVASIILYTLLRSLFLLSGACMHRYQTNWHLVCALCSYCKAASKASSLHSTAQHSTITLLCVPSEGRGRKEQLSPESARICSAPQTDVKSCSASLSATHASPRIREAWRLWWPEGCCSFLLVTCTVRVGSCGFLRHLDRGSGAGAGRGE